MRPNRIGRMAFESGPGTRSRASEIDTPSRTLCVAVRRLAGVIRFSVPSWSSAPYPLALRRRYIQATNVSRGIGIGLGVSVWPTLADDANDNRTSVRATLLMTYLS